MGNDVYSAGPVDVNVRPVAWLHDQPGRYDVVHDEVKAFWLKAWPKQVEHYTIPLYAQENAPSFSGSPVDYASIEKAVTLLNDISKEPAPPVFDADNPRFRQVFDEAVHAHNLPSTRKGDGYRSPITQWCFELAYSVVNRLRLYEK